MADYRYARWDGTQDVFPLGSEELMDRLSERLLATGNLTAALRAVMRDDLADAFGEPRGFEALIKKLRRTRRDILDAYDADSTLRDVTQRLADVESQERSGIARRTREAEERLETVESGHVPGEGNERDLVDLLRDIASRSLESLDDLPQDPAGRLGRLGDYEFMDGEANSRFQSLAGSLRNTVADHHFRGLAGRLGSIDPEDVARTSEMLHDLNRLLKEKISGAQPNFRRFMNRYSDLLGPDAPETLDDLVEDLQRQVAQMDSLLRSMSPEARRQMEDLMRSAFQDEGLAAEMTELARNLETLNPMRSLRREYPFSGEDTMTLKEGLGLIQRLQDLDALEQQLKRAQTAADPSEVEAPLLHSAMGQEAVHHLDSLKAALEHLEESGYVSAGDDGYELTPKGTRRIGQKALSEIFAAVRRGGAGSHATGAHGSGGDFTGETKRYEFGDPFALHLQRTLGNAALRRAASREASSEWPLRLLPEDLEVYRPEQVSRASTVLMIDMSLSMAMRGSFLAAKKVALALDALIRTRFPQDWLRIVGFSTYAREIKSSELSSLTWDEFDPYTNIQDGLKVAQRLLTRCPGGTKQIIMVSDGEPTAHVEEGQLYLQYPPSEGTLAQTLREVKRCAAQGITINTFMLDKSPGLIDFVDELSRIGRGRVFYTTPEKLGQYVVVDYLAGARRVLA